MLALNVIGLGLCVAGSMAMFWPLALTVRHPLRWVAWGLLVALVGFFLIRI